MTETATKYGLRRADGKWWIGPAKREKDRWGSLASAMLGDWETMANEEQVALHEFGETRTRLRSVLVIHKT